MNDIQIGYCTNVHAGADLAQTRENLARYALSVKKHFSPESPMGVGLWLSAPTARKLQGEGRTEEFAAWLHDSGLVPFTLNGFPYGDFHQPVVKHRVYEPTWFEAARADYTQDLIAILHTLLPAGAEGSISTMPIVWGEPRPTGEQLTQAADHLRGVARRLARLEQDTGRLIYLCLEPEPGCFLQRGDDIIRFFAEYLLPGGEEDALRRHVRVCHDVCHAAVMFEGQHEVLESFHRAGILVGKVQISSAVKVDWNAVGQEQREAAWRQLSDFAEDRYLHQTMVRRGAGEPPCFYQDLPAALAAETPSGEWRTHFHVPVYLAEFGHLQTTQDQIVECLRAARQFSQVTHYEVETYAWGVLPDALREDDLAAGIAHELQWFEGIRRL